MSESVIAAQMYTLREFTRTPEDIAQTMKKVKQMGYDVVQLSALGPIDPKELKSILDSEGLTVCATHNSFDRLRNEAETVIEEHRIWDCKYTAIASMPQGYRSAEGFAQFAKEASDTARKYKDAGISVGYHNHAFELERADGERTGLQVIYEDSDPQALIGEIDTYWIQYGGGDPAQYIRNLKGRSPLVHLKDMTVRSNQPIMAEVGEGNLNWESILAACKEAGVEWYIVEQDRCERDPFESLGISLRNLKAMGLQ